jgi:ectoine hydroxylase-related dioxygenase (phytanoyl-CoA dioxygenase family)
MEKPDDPRFGDFAGEMDVPVKAGDLLIGDARMFHATHANQSDAWRTVITIWFHPFFSQLAESTQRWLTDSHHGLHEKWPETAKRLIGPIIPGYTGTAEGYITRHPKADWNGGGSI